MSKCCCCTDVPDVSSLADNPRLIFSIYAIAFTPLAFIYALDFITEKWRSIRHTRRNGMIQLFVSLPSLVCVIFYITLQINNKDYKEAAAAIAVAVFNSYHVLRTIWGLILLYEFRNWNIYALRCLVRMGYHVPRYDHSDDVRGMISKMKTFVPQWKRPLFRLFENLKSSVDSLYHWSLSWRQPVSPSSVLTHSSSSSALPDCTIDENHSRVSHETNSSRSARHSTTDGSQSHHLRTGNSFSSTFPDFSSEDHWNDQSSFDSTNPTTLADPEADESQTRLFRFTDVLKSMKKNGAHFYSWAMGIMEEIANGVLSHWKI